MTGQAARMVQLKLEREDSRLVASPASGAELGGVLSENVRQNLFYCWKDVGCKLVELFFMDSVTIG